MANENQETPKSDERPNPDETTTSTTLAYRCPTLTATLDRLNDALGTDVKRLFEGKLVVTIVQSKP